MPREPMAPLEIEPANTGGGLLRFAATLGLGLLLLFGLMRTGFFREAVAPASLELSAGFSAAILSVLGEHAVADGNEIRSPRSTLRIGEACDALQPLAVFFAAVVAFPASTLVRALGLLGGAALLVLINQLRIVTLYFTGIHLPRAFDAMHTEVWQALFLLLGASIWLAWARWAIRSR